SVLEEDGYVVLGEAGSAEGALQLVEEHRPDVAVVDLVMDGTDGMGTVTELRSKHPEVPVVVISSLFDPVVEQQVLGLGAWYIEKVEGLEALEHMIDGAVSVTADNR